MFPALSAQRKTMADAGEGLNRAGVDVVPWVPLRHHRSGHSLERGSAGRTWPRPLPDNPGPALGFWRHQRYLERMLSRPPGSPGVGAENRWGCSKRSFSDSLA